MPSVKKGEKQSDYMHRCVPMLIKEGKKNDQAVAQCLNMFREHWQAKGEQTGVWELDIADASQSSIACSYCNAGIAMNYFQKIKRDDGSTILVTKLPKEGKLPTQGFMASAEMLPVPGSKLSPPQMFYFCNCSCRDNFKLSKKHISHPMTDLPDATTPNDKFIRLPSENEMG